MRISKLKRSVRTLRFWVACAVFVVFTLYAVSLVYPLIWAVFNALKTNLEYFRNPFALPHDWLFSNFGAAFDQIVIRTSSGTKVDLFGMFFNSLWFTVGTTALALSVSAMTAYVVSKYTFRFRGAVYGIAIFIMIIPVVGNLPAQYKLFNQLGLSDSPLLLLAYAGGFGFNFIVLYGFFKNISWSYAEAAFVDGAGHLKVFLKIMIPQAVPALVSLFIITAIGQWNDYMTPLLYLKNTPTLASGLFRFKELMTVSSNFPVYFAALLMSIVPILVLFAAFSETIMENTVAGGLKG